MLSSWVLLPSATLPPTLIKVLFAAYLAGRRHYPNKPSMNRAVPQVSAALDSMSMALRKASIEDTLLLPTLTSTPSKSVLPI